MGRRAFTFCLVAVALTIASVSDAIAYCSVVRNCTSATRYEMRPYRENVCQYYGRQRSCYIATRYSRVAVNVPRCTIRRICR